MTVRRLLVALAIMGLVSTAQAGQNAQEILEKMKSCQSCSAFMKHPEVSKAMRHDIFKTDKGFISAMAVSNESLVPEFRALNAQCLANHDKVMAMTAAERKEHLCVFCNGMAEITQREDVTTNAYETHMGGIFVVQATTDESIAALHAFATTAKETNELLATAMKGAADTEKAGMKAAKKATSN